MKKADLSNRRTKKFIKGIIISISIFAAAAACVISCFHVKGGSIR